MGARQMQAAWRARRRALRSRAQDIVAHRTWPAGAPLDILEDDLGICVQGVWWLEHGRVAEVGSVRPGRWGLGKCHSNAGWLAKRWPEHYRQWTGYVLVPGEFGILDNHSWVEVSGMQVEVTYHEPAAFYLGLPVPEEVLYCNCGGHPNDCLAFRALGRHP